jgi:hypothetical protein
MAVAHSSDGYHERQDWSSMTTHWPRYVVYGLSQSEVRCLSQHDFKKEDKMPT